MALRSSIIKVKEWIKLGSSSVLWRSVGTAAILSTLILISGFVYAVKDVLNPPPSNLIISPIDIRADKDLFTEGDKIQIVALGDSLTRGTGDQLGLGYVGRVKERLQTILEKPVYILANYSVNGYRTEQLLSDITTRSEVPNSISKADLIVLTIGGNDLFHNAIAGGNILESGATEVNPEAARRMMPAAISNLEEILSRIAELNTYAPIVYIGLYHPFRDIDYSGEGALVIDEWNRKAFEVANRYPNMTVVPTYDLFETNLLKYLYNDHFHPNQDGYRRIAERIIQVLE